MGVVKTVRFAIFVQKTDMNTDIPYTDEERESLRNCRLCPRQCGADRTEGRTGFCNCTDEIGVSLVCNHKGEEPVIGREKGICNVFFIHCNLQCIYCQNRQISRNGSRPDLPYGSFDRLIARIKEVLSESENVLGFVSPTHHLPLMKAVIRTLNSEGLHPRIVYNTNAYDNVEELKKLEGMVDIYLPDLKYMDRDLARRLSMAEDYPQRALEAIGEMYRQKGSSLLTDADDVLESGLIVRHLVLPDCPDNTARVLEAISDISPNIAVSLMSQYAPPEPMPFDFLNKRLSESQYEMARERFFESGLHKGWMQELSSQENLVPDFDKGTWSHSK